MYKIMGKRDGFQQLHVLFVIACHWAMSITLVFVNKHMVSSDNLGHDLTIVIAWSQSFISVVAILFGATVQILLDPSARWIASSPSLFFNNDVLAMSFAFVGVLVLNNLLLKHIGVAFYQVARSSTLVFSVVFSRFFLYVPVTARIAFSCFLIICGFLIGADEERALNSITFAGIAYGILASMVAALCGIYCKRVDKVVEGDALKIALLNNGTSIVLLFPLLFSTGQLHMAWLTGQLWRVALWWQLVVTGIVSMMVGWTSNKVISLTSPVTHNMSINAKSLLQTILAVILHEEKKTLLWWVGNLLVMLGIMLYATNKAVPASSEMTITIPEKKEAR